MLDRTLRACFGLACLAPVVGAGQAAPKEPAAARAFFHARGHRAQYAGPGREVPDPAGIDEVLIGYFGPDDPSHPQGGDMWCAAQMAIEEANRRGGYRGKRFRLVAGWSKGPWHTGGAQLIRMVYRDKVWAIIGGIDGPSTHLAEQVVAKARLTLLSPAATDKTANLANVPWMFSCLPGDHLLAPALAAEISARVGQKPFLLVSANDHDSHRFAVELKKCVAQRGMAPRYHFQCKRGARDVTGLVRRIVGSRAAAVVVVAGAHDSARLVAAIRGRGFTGPIFGGPTMGRRRFFQEVGAAADGVVFPLLYHRQEAPARFARAFESRFKRPPDYAAAHTYDALHLLIGAIGKAGLNRARIGDAVRELSPWTGVTGTVEWDSLGSNIRAIRLGTIRDGSPVPVEARDRARGASGLP